MPQYLQRLLEAVGGSYTSSAEKFYALALAPRSYSKWPSVGLGSCL